MLNHVFVRDEKWRDQPYCSIHKTIEILSDLPPAAKVTQCKYTVKIGPWGSGQLRDPD